MCSGKSRVGKIVADRLHWAHIDTDEMIQKDVGMPVGDIIRKRGEKAFRDLETKAIQLISLSDKSVISTGGGAPLNPENMKYLTQNGTVVWLQISPENVLKRSGSLKSRPLIDASDPLTSVKNRLQERTPIYARNASFSVDSNTLDLDQMADKIISFFPALLS